MLSGEYWILSNWIIKIRAATCFGPRGTKNDLFAGTIDIRSSKESWKCCALSGRGKSVARGWLCRCFGEERHGGALTGASNISRRAKMSSKERALVRKALLAVAQTLAVVRQLRRIVLTTDAEHIAPRLDALSHPLKRTSVVEVEIF